MEIEPQPVDANQEIGVPGAAAPTRQEIETLAATAKVLDTFIKTKVLELAELKAKLVKAAEIELGEEETGTIDFGHARVIFPKAAIKPPAPERLPSVRKVCGALFAKLFSREVIYKPVKNFRDAAKAALTEARAERVIDLIAEASSPKVDFK
jgi:hypothetical protein